jgi:hypothetical protein
MTMRPVSCTPTGSTSTATTPGARAEFIRLQCALAALPPDAPGRDDLLARELELLARHSADWLAPFPAFVRGLYGKDCRFERGFLAHLSLTAS